MTSEKLLEKKLREKVKSMGGIAIKIASASFTGMPDRMIIMPTGNVCFAELKSEGKHPTLRQEFVISKLRSYHLRVDVIDNDYALNAFLKFLERWAA